MVDWDGWIVKDERGGRLPSIGEMKFDEFIVHVVAAIGAHARAAAGAADGRAGRDQSRPYRRGTVVRGSVGATFMAPARPSAAPPRQAGGVSSATREMVKKVGDERGGARTPPGDMGGQR
jgi:hypothetical protein